jgi:DNA gyrase/topoisomerase IV subunit A
MINRARIEDWIRQVQAQPVAAPLVIRQITDRLIELDEMNEQLRAENLTLSSGARVREFERRIAELEFQVNLFRRQGSIDPDTLPAEKYQLVLYNDRGQILRLECSQADFTNPAGLKLQGDVIGEARAFGMLVTRPSDQLLLVFSTGRTIDLPIENIPPSSRSALEWRGAYREEPRPLEELVAVQQVTQMGYYDLGAQISRFGYAKKITQAYLKTFLVNKNIGKGTRFDFDRLLTLILCNPDDLIVTASKLGNFLGVQAAGLPVALEELVKFRAGDYLIGAMRVTPEQSLLAMTHDGKAYHFPREWILPEKAGERKSRLLNLEKKGSYLVGAAAAGPGDRGMCLREDGSLAFFAVDETSQRGTQIGPSTDAPVLAFTAFSQPGHGAQSEDKTSPAGSLSEKEG